MQGSLWNVATMFGAFARRAPAIRFGGSGNDWLPPVLGPGDWSSAAMASMADSNAAWYFDRMDRPSA